MSNDDTPAVPEDVDRELDDLADELQEPHHDEAERRKQQKAAEEAGSNPRRES
jgi:hypothetical protein